MQNDINVKNSNTINSANIDLFDTLPPEEVKIGMGIIVMLINF